MALKVIHLGFGGWGKSWHRDVIKRYRGVKVVGIVDMAPSVLAEMQKEFGYPSRVCFTQLEEAIDSVRADAVINTSSVGTHVPVGKIAINAGLNYLTEKPFAPSEKDGRELVELAKRKGRILMVAQNYRFHPAVRTVRRILASGKLGAVCSVGIDFRRYGNSRDPETAHYHIEEPLLLDMAVHHFDMMRAVLGKEPVDIACRGNNPAWSRFDQSPTAAALVRFENDILVSYRGSWIAHQDQTNWTGNWTMECEKGAVEWTSRGQFPDRVSVHTNGGKARDVRLAKMKYTDRAGVLAHFAAAVRNGTTPETSGCDNIGTLRLVHAAIKSARRNITVRL